MCGLLALTVSVCACERSVLFRERHPANAKYLSKTSGSDCNVQDFCGKGPANTVSRANRQQVPSIQLIAISWIETANSYSLIFDTRPPTPNIQPP